HDLIVFELQIHDAALAEARNRIAGLRVERDQPVAGRDVEDPLFAAIAPVGEPAAGELAGRRLAALAFALAVHPHQLAGRGAERQYHQRDQSRDSGDAETPAMNDPPHGSSLVTASRSTNAG